MTDTTEQKALALVNAVREERGFAVGKGFERNDVDREALCRAIEQLEAEKAARAADREQHEADKQWFSEAARKALPVIEMLSASMIAGVKKRAEVEAAIQALTPFIIAKPDPLVEVLEATGDDEAVERAWRIRSLMANRGYEWRKIEGEG